METQTFNPELIVDTYGDMVYKIALSQMKNVQDAEDVYQEAFLRLVRAQNMDYSGEHCKAWLIRVTLNLCKDQYRRRKRHSDQPLPETLAAPSEEEDTIFYYTLRLPEKYRQVIHLFYYEDMGIEQISRVLQQKESTIKSWLHRGRKALKKILEKEAPANEWRL